MGDRDYQQHQIEKAAEEVSAKRKILVQLPTGGGKTYEFALLTQRFVRNTESAVLILVHREELLKQASKTIKSVTGIDPYLITSSTKRFKVASVYIGMVESTLSRLHLFHNVGLVIIDECHIANFNKVHSVFLEELIIGFTATPISSSKKEPLNKYYNSIVTGPQIPELIKLGFLAQNVTRCPKEIVDSTQFEIDNRKGDFNENMMATEFKKPKFVLNVFRNYAKFCRHEKTIIFNVNIAHSLEVTDCLIDCGVNARHLDSNSSNKPSIRPGFENEREEVIDWFKHTEDAVLCNVMIATVGFDEPSIKHVILNFSTLSVVKFIQCAGRGGRSYPGKEFFNIIDLGGNCVRFGDWSDERDWQYIFENPDQPGDGVAPVKVCPSCDGLLHAAATVCTLLLQDGNLCLHEFKRKPTAQEQDMHEMILITKNIDVDALVSRSKAKHEYYPMMELGHDVVRKMYEEYPSPHDNIIDRHFKAYYELCKDWYNKYKAGVNGNLLSIDDSSWHIRKAKYNFDDLVKKLKPVQTLFPICVCCGDEATKTCDSCVGQVCVNCIDREGVCLECQEVNASHTRSVRGY